MTMSLITHSVMQWSWIRSTSSL